VTAKSKSKKARSRNPDTPSEIEARIRQRAFELYEQRGKADGFDLDDWHRAETETLGAQKQQRGQSSKRIEVTEGSMKGRSA
jgi:hypothetical protein